MAPQRMPPTSVAFVGAFASGTKAAIEAAARASGYQVHACVTQSTGLLVIGSAGDTSSNDAANRASAKAHRVPVLSEEDWAVILSDETPRQQLGRRTRASRSTTAAQVAPPAAAVGAAQRRVALPPGARAVAFVGNFTSQSSAQVQSKAACLGFVVHSAVSDEVDILVLGGAGDAHGAAGHQTALALGTVIVLNESEWVAAVSGLAGAGAAPQAARGHAVIEVEDDDDEGGDVEMAEVSSGSTGRALVPPQAVPVSATSSSPGINSAGAPAAAGPVEPLLRLSDGEQVNVQSESSSSVYRIKRTGDHYYCTCPAWRNQNAAVDRRTCKHLKSKLGEAFERARVGASAAPSPKRMRGAASSSGSSVLAAGPEPKRAKPARPALLLASSWDERKDVTGWLLSEKLDGVRAFWTGTEFRSRLGNVFPASDEFKRALPAIPLDGELFMGRGKFNETVSIVKTTGHNGWASIRYHVFDAPEAAGTFEARLDAASRAISGSSVATLVAHVKVRDNAHALAERARVVGLGGEGVMLREPGSAYVGRRSTTLLKSKTFQDAEAVVEGYIPGAGRHAGRVGSLQCRLKSGVSFCVGSGLTDAQRDAPPAVGAVITFRYQELTPSGTPRFPTFIGEAVDKAGATI